MKLNATHINLSGGTLISPTHVLTAAHNVQDRNTLIDFKASQIKVYIGEHRKGDSKFNVLTVAEVIKHPKYNTKKGSKYDNDIAILRLSEAVNFNSEVSPACLPADAKSTYEGQRVTLSGWGLLGDSGGFPIPLQEVDVTVTTKAKCKKVWGRRKITSNMICAGGSGKGACTGDSGGPLIARENGRHTLVIALDKVLHSRGKSLQSQLFPILFC